MGSGNRGSEAISPQIVTQIVSSVVVASSSRGIGITEHHVTLVKVLLLWVMMVGDASPSLQASGSQGGLTKQMNQMNESKFIYLAETVA